MFDDVVYLLVKGGNDMAILAYRIIELIDGERWFQVIPYRLAQAVKWWILSFII